MTKMTDTEYNKMTQRDRLKLEDMLIDKWGENQFNNWLFKLPDNTLDREYQELLRNELGE